MACAALLAGCSRSDDDTKVTYKNETGQKVSALPQADGNYSYEVLGGQPVPHEAKRLHEQARAEGQAGRYDAALKLFDQAITAAPDWEYPHYDMAFTYLLKGDDDKALQKYQQVDKMEPSGFFITKTALWTLERERDGKFPKGTYIAYVALEWASQEEKSNRVERIIERLPDFTPAWKDKVLLTEDRDLRAQYLDKALAMESDRETHGLLVLNKAAGLRADGKKADAQTLLENLATNQASTIANKALARKLLKKFKK